MKNHKRIILELMPEEIKMLAYGAIPKDLKMRLKEIAYYLDDQLKSVTDTIREKDIELKKSKDKQHFEKKYNCQKCGRPIVHKGNCFPCNLIAKYKREGREIPKFWQNFIKKQKLKND